MADNNPPADDAPRAVVNKLLTSRCTGYEADLVASGTGADVSTATYTIASDVVAPRPTVTLKTYYTFDENGDEVTLAAERVQAVYRDGGTRVLDPVTGRFYTRYIFYVLVSLDVPNGAGAVVNCFAWSADPAAAGLPPFDAATGRQGFGFLADWTWTPVSV